MSGKIVNLREARKQKARAEKRTQGDENAARFGQSKAMTNLYEARFERDARALDGKKRERDHSAEGSDNS